jgi:hypothetical protein
MSSTTAHRPLPTPTQPPPSPYLHPTAEYARTSAATAPRAPCSFWATWRRRRRPPSSTRGGRVRLNDTVREAPSTRSRSPASKRVGAQAKHLLVGHGANAQCGAWRYPPRAACGVSHPGHRPKNPAAPRCRRHLGFASQLRDAPRDDRASVGIRATPTPVCTLRCHHFSIAPLVPLRPSVSDAGHAGILTDAAHGPPYVRMIRTAGGDT